MLQGKGGVAYLNNNVVLTLFGLFENGKQVGTQLGFQRLGITGDPITGVMLNFGLNPS
jgi:hypothetical protein